jgi:hypothetical protein
MGVMLLFYFRFVLYISETPILLARSPLTLAGLTSVKTEQLEFPREIKL